MIGRYLLLKPRVVHKFTLQAWPGTMKVYVDAKLAGCPKTHRSTTGVALVHGGHLIRPFSNRKTQCNIALASAEAALYAIVSASSEGWGCKAMAQVCGADIKVDMFVDAPAAICIAKRKGLSRITHLDTQALWVQDAVRQKRFQLAKVRGTQDPADMMTKYLDGHALHEMIVGLNLETRDGRPEIAPTMAEDFGEPMEDTEQELEADALEEDYENIKDGIHVATEESNLDLGVRDQRGYGAEKSDSSAADREHSPQVMGC